eukprot:TRINITY_DN4738_c0_g1_i2.p1 TRINITY_DN4738_c0_g1~~TRINITY_DN4738_c0_g1_i2.p1  ORF type:complete len:344 (+),score=109.40 TRINITY_DN4738_c0_g1_i2:24-1034(+)
MIRRPPRSTHCISSAASDVYKRQVHGYAKLVSPSGLIVRTRDEQIIKKGKIVYDVGGVFSVEERRFDHHMKDFKETFDGGHSIKLSSCGLAYRHFGRHTVKNVLAEWGVSEEKCVEYVYHKVYEDLIMAIDAMDNGISQYPPENDPKYRINTHLGSRVARCNPAWNSGNEKEKTIAGFYHALQICEEEFLWQMHSQACILYPAFAVVEKGYKDRFAFHSSGQLLHLQTACPWGQQLRALEEADKEGTKVLFVVYSKDAEFAVQGVPEKPGSFACRLFLNEKWRGLRGDELVKVSGLPGASFVHASGFIGVAKSLETVVKMAELTIAEKNAKMADVS